MSGPENKTPGKVAYINARLLDPASGLDEAGSILTDGETIADMGPALFKDGVPAGVETVDCKGLCLAPGLVDARIQVPGQDFATPGRAAVAGGVTTAICLPNTDPIIDDMAVVEYIARSARKVGLTKVYAYGAVTKGLEGKELAEMAMLSEAGAVAFTDGDRAVHDALTMHRALSYTSTFDLMIVQHPEETSLATGGVMNMGETATRLGLTGIPPEAEVIQVERDLHLLRMSGGRLHFAHISTAAAAAAIRRAKKDGLAVSCDTAPPYFALNETAIGDYRTFAKLSPPLRSEDDRAAITEALADGTIDFIASDHTPRHEDTKRLPFAQAAFGGVGLETLLAVSLELYHNKKMSLLDVLTRLTTQPADAFGLPAGKLARNEAADLVLFDVDRGWKVDEDTLTSKAKNTPFDGRPLQGRVARTVVDGRCVFESEQ